MTKVVNLSAEIGEAYRSGEMVVALAKKYQVSLHAIYDCIKRSGVKIRPVRPSIGLEDEIVAAYLNGVPVAHLAKQYKNNPGTIRRILVDRDIQIRCNSDSNRRYTLDKTFFDEIDTENKAYVLGLLVADGYNNQKDGSVKLTLTDLDLMNTVAAVMGTNNPLWIKVPLKGKLAYQLSMSSRHLSDALGRKGCPQRKTFITEIPTKDIVPDHLLNAYVRGYMDGDGCIHLRKGSKNKVVHIVGTEKFLTEMAKLFQFRTFVRRRHGNRIWFFAIYALENVHRFRDWIYQGATIFLARKRALFYQLDAAA